MLHVRELVRDHPFELLIVQHPHDAFSGGNRGMARIPAGGKRVRRAVGNHIHLRHRQVRARGEPSRVIDSRCSGPTSCARYIFSTILSENQ